MNLGERNNKDEKWWPKQPATENSESLITADNIARCK